MVLEGLIEEPKLDEFNLPYYAPTEEEVKKAVEAEVSFDIRELETYKMDWDSSASSEIGLQGKSVAGSIRAMAKSLFASHFANVNMDDLFERYAKKVTEYLEVVKGQCTTMLISMTKELKK
ncbi:hypothetical protein SLE2022_201130 [Rubroshorea leprosula]